ncbi:nucleolar protein 16 [Candida albicans P87]|nr:nucleolar protein 16 [Candida albicans P37005]KGR00549.1 nucleolar protein 16 [Candida albicans GC75]KGT70336.1 nucleolar protein 16 [Candida albicans 12C]KGU11250.1 nucleolar protein 16 [Candida albicans P87]KGU33036.1 nucleolar protein 16 [Candida albicans P75063]KHC44668.1 nucleolar protein 16 [Candida albicans Ca6]KHC58060.1 nucleolar protein 16 [Candida albicans P37039]KHC72839.1 nucleolar protein 16 [Candida albicans P75016]
MTSVRKRKMARSSVKKNTRRTKDKQRNINIHSNPIIEANWDKSLTLKQNYKRLGLRAKLGRSAGGDERKVESLSELQAKREKNQKNQSKHVPTVSEIENLDDPSRIPEGEARLIRDPETNEVIKVIYGTMKVDDNDESEEEIENPSVIKQLEEYAEKNSKIKKERHQSERENDWIKSLYEKYGDDYDKMKWDKKLNIYQQSAGDLKRRIIKWKKANGI